MEQQEWFSQHCFIVVVLVNHGLDLSTKRLPSSLVGQCSMPHQGSYDLYCTEPSSLSVPPLLVLPPSLHVQLCIYPFSGAKWKSIGRFIAY